MRSTLVLTFASLSIACSSGGTAPSGNPAPLGGREVPTFLRDAPGGGRESPMGGRESPSPSTAGGGTCIQCNTTYTCNVSGKPTVITVTAQPGGWCGSKDGGLMCGGVVVDGNAMKDGTWIALPGGGFQLCTLAGDCSISCTPGGQVAPPGPTPTPNPTPTPAPSSSG